ncbi:DUF2185 domain-containing protein [Novipirellula sp.]|uniref:DUF2185 domain-containing protein n=1 Tax=Novipirellula sp. TaxID=2795430 RepID=UPI00356823E8
MKKKFALSAAEIQPLAEGFGGCFATDAITVDGNPVGYMYREEPDFEEDSGWRFLAGVESQKYLDDANNTGIYDVNEIANFDPDIIPLLDSPEGSAFERDEESGAFVAVSEDDDDEDDDED